MAFGDNPHDRELRDGWYALCDRIKEAGDHVFKDASGASDGERTNAFRYLTQNLSQAFDLFLENRDDRYPSLHAFCGPTRKLGVDNPDCIYLQSWINDRDTYRISGHRGTARMLNLTVQGEWTGALHEPFGDRPLANVFGDDLTLDDDGAFELWISPDPQPGDWIPSQPGTRKIFYRQYFDHWDEVPAAFEIERVGSDGAPPPAIEPAWLLDSFEQAASFVVNTTKDWPDVLFGQQGMDTTANEFVRSGDAEDARRGRVVQQVHWRLETDEALVLEFTASPDAFWQLGACTVFGASLEYRYRQVSLTAGMAPVDSDGTTRVVLSHADPGLANWLDTQDHTRGWLVFRNMLTGDVPDIATRVVKARELGDELGGVATAITPGERHAELRRRRLANLRRFPA